jgi:anti-sigma factor RsiW
VTPCPKMEELSAYIDGALRRDEELSLRFHLDDCGSCREKVKVLLALKDTVARNAEFYPVPAILRESLRSRLQPSPWSFLRRPWVLRPVIAFALLLAVVSVAWWWRDGGTQQRYEAIARALVADHMQSLHVSNLSDIASADPSTLAAWFQERVPFPVLIPQPRDVRLLGGRLCSLLGHHGAVVFYEHQGTRLSLFTMAADILSSEERATLQAASQARPHCLRTAEGRPLCLVCSRDTMRAVVMDDSSMEEVAVKLVRAF